MFRVTRSGASSIARVNFLSAHPNLGPGASTDKQANSANETCSNRRIMVPYKLYTCTYCVYENESFLLGLSNFMVYCISIRYAAWFCVMCTLRIRVIQYDNPNDFRFSRLLIGAPEAQTDQPGVVKGGAVYRCGTSREGDCEEIPFDTRGKFSHVRPAAATIGVRIAHS